MSQASFEITCLEPFRTRQAALLLDDGGEFRACIVAPAEGMIAERMNELLTIGTGLTFVALSEDRCRSFLLGPMSRPRAALGVFQNSENPDILSACESVEAREGVSTGISAADRAKTISILAEERPEPRRIVRPGHVFPVAVRKGGVLVKQALPEGALDLVTLAGYRDAALFIDVLRREGDFGDEEYVRALSNKYKLPLIPLSQITRARLEKDSLLQRVALARLPTVLAGELTAIAFLSSLNDAEHVALVKGSIEPDETILTRVQPEFAFGDVFGGHNPGTRDQIDRSLKAIGERGKGVLVYLRRPFAGQLGPQLLQQSVSFHERPAWMVREYGIGAQILRNLGVRKVELLTGSTKNLVGLQSFGIEIVSQRPIPAWPGTENNDQNNSGRNVPL